MYSFFIFVLIILAVYFVYFAKQKPTYYLVARIDIIIEFAFLTLIFFLKIKSLLVRAICIPSIIAFALLCIYDFQITPPSIAYLPLLVECLFFIVLITYFFIETINNDEDELFSSKFMFWLSVAFFINFSGNFSLFLYSESISFKDESYKFNFTIIYSTVTILKNLILCYAISKRETHEIKFEKSENLHSTVKEQTFKSTLN